MICTRDRGDSISATIRSIFACTYPHFNVLIIDQSSDLHTEQAISAFRGDPRLRYVHTSIRGKSRAENTALSLIKTEFVILTDDDCEVPSNWISEMVAPFIRYPQVGIVFCDVTAAPHDTSAGWIPVSLSSRAMLVEDLAHWQTCDGVNIGIGAGMAIRYAAARAIGGFNPLFGPGSPFRSGDDVDFTLHALAAGYQIYRLNHVGVVHYGFRSYEQGRHLTHRNLFGIGGIYGQLLRRGHWVVLLHYLNVFKVIVLVPTLKDIARLSFPRKWGRAFWLLRGLIEGLRTTPPSRTRGFLGLPSSEKLSS